MNRKIGFSEERTQKFNKYSNSKLRKFDALMTKYEMAKNFQAENEENEPKMKQDQLEFLQKIDFHSLMAYLFAYILFNCIYWIDMLFN